MRKKILLLANIKSSYTIQYIENVLKPLGLDIYMQLSLKDIENVKDLINRHNIKVINTYERGSKFIFKFGFLGNRLRNFLNMIELIKNKPFDFIHIQYVTLYSLICCALSKSKDSKCYASFWGSDILRESKKNLRKKYKYLSMMNCVSADGIILKNVINKIYPKMKTKFELIPYGVSLIDYIDKYSKDRLKCKDYFKFPQSKKVIAIGYNAKKEQQQDKVIDSLSKMNNKKSFFLVFQMTYGNITDESYIPKLKEKIKKSGFEYKIFNNYLSMDDLAKLRVATDVFINAQTTDAFANSFIENIYSKTMILNAKWLHYPELDIFPLYVKEFSDFSEIPLLLEQTIDDDKMEWNIQCIKNRTWDNCRNKWAEVYGL